MVRYKLTIEYDGGAFAGWQRQENAMTVQGALEAAITAFSGETPTLHAAGRTDAGVHAWGQVAHFDLARDDMSAATVRDAINFHIRPHRAVVLDALIANLDFHARFSAISRAYRYHIVSRRAPLVLESAHAWHIPGSLNADMMQKAADMLIGKHDFSTFRAAGCQADSPLKTLDELRVERDGEKIVITARARSFLYRQVRNMVGTLSSVGLGRWSLDDFNQAFLACDRAQGGLTAPPHGLFFLGPLY
ncbi:MAG: tRNA pseudouridine(38-40) synthase TruA [Alphaproteobacteria bacterium]